MFTYTSSNHQNKIKKRLQKRDLFQGQNLLDSLVIVKSLFYYATHLKCEWQTRMQIAPLTELMLSQRNYHLQFTIFTAEAWHDEKGRHKAKFKRYITCLSNKEHGSRLNLVNTTFYLWHLLWLAVLSGGFSRVLLLCPKNLNGLLNFYQQSVTWQQMGYTRNGSDVYINMYDYLHYI